MTIHTTGIFCDAPEGARPLAVSVKTVCELVGVGNTTMWALIKMVVSKQFVSVGGAPIIYASLERLLILEDGAAS